MALTFLSWSRERIGDLATSTASGRARGQTTVTLAGTDAGGTTTSNATRTLAFLLAGPADVHGLQPGAIAARYPVAGAIDAETDKCTHVELAEPTLPWRYSPAGNPAAGTGALHPWLVLVVGVDGDEVTIAGDQVTLSPGVQALHPLGSAAPFARAHVQVDEAGRRVGRLLSTRPLDGGTEYLAVVVPAFTAAGAPAWTGAGAVTLALYDHWRFRTASPPGGFRDLAERLEPGEADPETGRAPVDYPRVPDAGDLEVRGALAPLGSTDATLPPEIRGDTAALLAPARDPEGRPIVGLPVYGDAWHAAPRATTWGENANLDARRRGVAGLGLELGIRLQEELAADAVAHQGALAIAGRRIGDLALGLAASASLWDRRVPADPINRLWLLGPALRRVVTDQGSLDELATADDRPLPHGLFSSAVRRMLRAGPARTALLRRGAPTPAEVLAFVNRCPTPLEATEDGVSLGDAGPRFDVRLAEVLASGDLDYAGLAAAVQAIDLEQTPQRCRRDLDRMRRRLLASPGEAAPWAPALVLLTRALRLGPRSAGDVTPLLEAISDLMASWDELSSTPADLLGLLAGLQEPGKGEMPPCKPVNLAALATGVTGAFDPKAPDGPVRVRVLTGIDGLDPAQPLAPPEICIGLDRPVWRDLQDSFAEWLLPGVGALPSDSVIALETNPEFTDALLLGYNTQLLAELRWRNISVASGCTPLRVFWERAHTATGDRIDDITSIAGWQPSSSLGDPSHRPGGAAGRDLVLVVRGALLQRYPRTLVYLVSAEHAGTVDFDADPAAQAARILPTFQGRIGSDVTFFGFQGLDPAAVLRHWLVLEEPPAGYRFYNVAHASIPPVADGAAFAAAAFADPVRVLIRGDTLVPDGGS